jgi:hypothetical protein
MKKIYKILIAVTLSAGYSSLIGLQYESFYGVGETGTTSSTSTTIPDTQSPVFAFVNPRRTRPFPAS